VVRAAEHLRLFEHGLTLDPDTAERPERRAEALRNACVVAAWFAGHTNFAPGEPISMVDQDRPMVSAWASGQDPATERFDVGHAERVADRLRELGVLTLRLAEARAGDDRKQPAGYERALGRLREVGALAAGDDDAAGPVDEARFGEALIEAALDCAADVPPESARFLVADRRQSRLVADELDELVGLTLAGPAMKGELVAAVDREVARRREDLEQVRTGSETA
jgi:hypothetical protein